MSSTKQSEDFFAALRTVIDTLQPFDPADQERIIRWACEKIGLKPQNPTELHLPLAPGAVSPPITPVVPADGSRKDIKSFVDSKNPQSEVQFAATVAYFYQFEAPETERLMNISKAELVEATRKTNRKRINHPTQILANAHSQGYFDKAERGRYALNTVGENLVAMTLPQADGARSAKTPKRRKPSKKAAKKKK